MQPLVCMHWFISLTYILLLKTLHYSGLLQLTRGTKRRQLQMETLKRLPPCVIVWGKSFMACVSYHQAWIKKYIISSFTACLFCLPHPEVFITSLVKTKNPQFRLKILLQIFYTSCCLKHDKKVFVRMLWNNLMSILNDFLYLHVHCICVQ